MIQNTGARSQENRRRKGEAQKGIKEKGKKGKRNEEGQKDKGKRIKDDTEYRSQKPGVRRQKQPVRSRK